MTWTFFCISTLYRSRIENRKWWKWCSILLLRMANRISKNKKPNRFPHCYCKVLHIHTNIRLRMWASAHMDVLVCVFSMVVCIFKWMRAHTIENTSIQIFTFVQVVAQKCLTSEWWWRMRAQSFTPSLKQFDWYPPCYESSSVRSVVLLRRWCCCFCYTNHNILDGLTWRIVIESNT